jgi:hypothetical protein
MAERIPSSSPNSTGSTARRNMKSSTNGAPQTGFTFRVGTSLQPGVLKVRALHLVHEQGPAAFMTLKGGTDRCRGLARTSSFWRVTCVAAMVDEHDAHPPPVSFAISAKRTTLSHVSRRAACRSGRVDALPDADSIS